MAGTMRKKIALIILTVILFTGCSAPNVTPSTEGGGPEPGGSSAESQPASETGGSAEAVTERTSASGQRFDIHFAYTNAVYDYELEAQWRDVAIYKESFTYPSGLELLLDGTTEMFKDLDLNQSDDLTQDEWVDYEEDIFFQVIDIKSDGRVTLEEFGYFTAQLEGVFLSPSEDVITAPGNEDYTIAVEDSDSIVSLKILRAGEGGYRSPSGIVFPEGTVFVELISEYDVELKEMPGFELSPGFEGPLLSMYLEQDYAANNNGALGFSSIVDTQTFNRIFSGQTFTLNYEGKGESGVLDTYHLTITPR